MGESSHGIVTNSPVGVNETTHTPKPGLKWWKGAQHIGRYHILTSQKTAQTHCHLLEKVGLFGTDHDEDRIWTLCSIHRAVERLGWKGTLKISLSIVLEAVVPLQCRREDCPGRGGSVSQWVTAHPASKAPQGGTSSETSWAPPVKAFSRQTDTLTTMLQHLQPSHWLTGDLLPEYFGGCG